MSMTYDEFKEAVVGQIKDHLPASFSDHDVTIQSIAKNNDTYRDAVVISNSEVNISPSIYLDGFYDQIKSGRPLDTVLDRIAEVRTSNDVRHDFDVEKILDFDSVKDMVKARLVSAEYNKEMLETLPHTQINDLAVTYYLDLGHNDRGSYAISINETIMNYYGVTTPELHELAMANTTRTEEVSLKSMYETIRGLFATELENQQGLSHEDALQAAENAFPSRDDNMYVLTNTDGVNGAISITNPDVMTMVSDELGGDFYVLPSSIHEVIVIPVDDRVPVEALEQMVHEVNETEVLPEERLSDNVYFYDSESRELVLAVEAEERIAKRTESLVNETITEYMATPGTTEFVSDQELAGQDLSGLDTLEGREMAAPEVTERKTEKAGKESPDQGTPAQAAPSKSQSSQEKTNGKKENKKASFTELLQEKKAEARKHNEERKADKAKSQGKTKDKEKKISKGSKDKRHNL